MECHHLRMRIRVRVTAPVEKLSYIRRANGRPIRTGAEPKIPAETDSKEKRIFSHRDGVIYRLSGGGKAGAPAQPVNNAGEAIQPPRLSRPAPRRAF